MMSLLPPNASELEKHLEQAMIPPITISFETLWHPQTCPTELLPQLAWALSVDEWDNNWSEDQKRNSIKESYRIHSKKGTPNSIHRLLKAAGYGDIVIVEGLDAKRYDNTISYAGTHFHGKSDGHWAMYRIYLHRPITLGQAREIRRMLAQTAPVRCQLMGLHYDQALHLYDQKFSYNGNYSHGVA